MKRLVIVLLLLVLAVSIPAQNIFVPQFTSVGDTIKIPVSKPGNKSTVFDFETRALKCAGITSTGDITGIVVSDSAVFAIIVIDSAYIKDARIDTVVIDSALVINAPISLTSISVDTLEVDSLLYSNGMVVVDNDLYAYQIYNYGAADGIMAFADSSVTVTVVKQLQWNPVTNTTDSLFTPGEHPYNVSFRADTLIIEEDGVYNIDLRLTVGGANKINWGVAVAINDTTELAGCVQFTSEASSYAPVVTFCQRALEADDILIPMIRNYDSTGDPVIKCGSLRVTKIRKLMND